MYNLLTIGAENMVVVDGFPEAHFKDNMGSSPFPSIISLLRGL
jgi:hypothetical protein